MDIDLQPTLESDMALLVPLRPDDFEALYALASDPRVWEQHPTPDRWQRPVFETFFAGAMASGGAFRVVDKASGQTAGSTRFYDLAPDGKSILVGYTFYGTAFWGTGLNLAVKALMLDYIFPFVEQVYFHIGAVNVRSQIAIGRLGAKKVAEQMVAYSGERANPNYIYRITREGWQARGVLGPYAGHT